MKYGLYYPNKGFIVRVLQNSIEEEICLFDDIQLSFIYKILIHFEDKQLYYNNISSNYKNNLGPYYNIIDIISSDIFVVPFITNENPKMDDLMPFRVWNSLYDIKSPSYFPIDYIYAYFHPEFGNYVDYDIDGNEIIQTGSISFITDIPINLVALSLNELELKFDKYSKCFYEYIDDVDEIYPTHIKYNLSHHATSCICTIRYETTETKIICY